MARLTDHDVRDAEDALRKELSLIVGRYMRRMLEMGKAHVQEALETAVKEGTNVDGTSLGRTAAERAAFPYFGGLAGKQHDVVEGAASHAIEAA